MELLLLSRSGNHFLNSATAASSEICFVQEASMIRKLPLELPAPEPCPPGPIHTHNMDLQTLSPHNIKTSNQVQAPLVTVSQRSRAISFVTKNFFSKANGNRSGAPNVVVVMVDGWPTDKVEEASRLARESGINIFFITIEGAVENEKQYVVEPNFANKAVCRTNGFYSLHVQSWFGLHKILQPLVKRVCDTDRLACSKTCLNSADIGFVIDGSSSVGTGNFRTVLQFVTNISKEFEISDTDTRIGAVQYTYEQRLEFGFDKYSSKPDILNAIKRVGYWSGGTSTGAAINFALEQLFMKSKPNKRKLMILITDGRSYDDVRIPAMAAHLKGKLGLSSSLGLRHLSGAWWASGTRKLLSFYALTFSTT
ncbi:hypothetical protein P7K49_028867 [Saguinus oedipus]|uniref:VWFA domain-containing protein n=1 Tax=Saguinus oedipus TaxID=9490 RepID=A0ABQ9U5L0_SAGOE|nr:hypothetical protein P7K49_028867 [Saguinus oedipus]